MRPCAPPFSNACTHSYVTRKEEYAIVSPFPHNGIYKSSRAGVWLVSRYALRPRVIPRGNVLDHTHLTSSRCTVDQWASTERAKAFVLHSPYPVVIRVAVVDDGAVALCDGAAPHPPWHQHRLGDDHLRADALE